MKKVLPFLAVLAGLTAAQISSAQTSIDSGALTPYKLVPADRVTHVRSPRVPPQKIDRTREEEEISRWALAEALGIAWPTLIRKNPTALGSRKNISGPGCPALQVGIHPNTLDRLEYQQNFDQGDFGICAAFANTSFLQNVCEVNTRRFSQESDENFTVKIHPFWMAYLNWRAKDFGIGTIQIEWNLKGISSIVGLIQSGEPWNCDSDYIEERFRKLEINWQTLLEISETYYEPSEKWRAITGSKKGHDAAKAFFAAVKRDPRAYASIANEVRFMQRIYEAYNGYLVAPLRFMVQEALPECRIGKAETWAGEAPRTPEHQSRLLKYEDSLVSHQLEILSPLQVAAALRQGKTSLVGYDAAVFYRDAIDRQPVGKGINHRSVVVGQAWLGGKCQALVRNSWGNSRSSSRNCWCQVPTKTGVRFDFCSTLQAEMHGIRDAIGKAPIPEVVGCFHPYASFEQADARFLGLVPRSWDERSGSH